MPATYGLVGEYDDDPYEASYSTSGQNKRVSANPYTQQQHVPEQSHYEQQQYGQPQYDQQYGQQYSQQPYFKQYQDANGNVYEQSQPQSQSQQPYQQDTYSSDPYNSSLNQHQHQNNIDGSDYGSATNMSSAYANTNTNTISSAQEELLSPDYFDISPLLNHQDSVTMHFMVQSALVDAKGIRILSYKELQDLKNEAHLLASRLHDLDQKLEMETKLRDAAANLSKLHLQRNSSQKSVNGGASRRSFLKMVTANTSNGGSNGEMSNKDRKRLSKHAEEELEVSNRRISNYQAEHTKLFERYSDVNTKILHHNIGILAYAQFSKQQEDLQSQSKQAEKQLPSDSAVDHSDNSYNNASGANPNAVRATTRMKKHFRTSHLANETSLGAVSLDDSDSGRLDELISLVSGSIQSSTVSPRPPSTSDSTHEKLDYLKYLCTNLIGMFETDQEEKNHLTSIIVEALNELNPGVEPDKSTLREQLIEAVFRLKDAYTKSREAAEISSRESSRGIDLNDEILDSENSKSSHAGRSLLKKRLESLTVSYETNRQELERLELENVDLRNSLNEAKFDKQARVQQLESELKVSDERVQEWKERCESLQAELESVVKSLEDVTRQAVDYETERGKLEARVNELEEELFQQSNDTFDKRVSMISAPNSPSKSQTQGQNQKYFQHEGDRSIDSVFKGINADGSEQLSVPILRHEFRKIVMEINAKYAKDLKKEQNEKKRLESLLRSIKRSSYAATIPQSKLDALEANLNRSE